MLIRNQATLIGLTIVLLLFLSACKEDPVASLDTSDIKWTEILDREGLAEWVNHAAETKDGDYIILGPSYSDTTDLFQDMWLNKFDYNGNLLWQKVFGDSGADYGNWAAEAADGSIYLFGGHGNLLPDSSSYVSQMWLIKTNKDGNLLWEKKFGSEASESWGVSGCLSDNGNIFVSGYYDEQPSVLLLDENANIVWKREITLPTEGRYARSLTSCADGGVVGASSNYIFALSESGEMLWSTEVTSTDESSSVREVRETPDGGFVVLQRTSGSDVVKLNADRDEVWRRSSGENYFWGLADNLEEGIVITGRTFEENTILLSLDYNNSLLWSKEYGSGSGLNILPITSGGLLITGTSSSFSENDSDFLIIKTDINGVTEGGSTGTTASKQARNFFNSNQSDLFDMPLNFE